MGNAIAIVICVPCPSEHVIDTRANSGPGSQTGDCDLGTDCADCGRRQTPHPPRSPPDPPPPPNMPPRAPPPSTGFEFQPIYAAYIVGGFAVLFAVWVSRSVLAKRATLIQASRTANQEQWAKAGIGHLHPNALPVVAAEAMAVPVMSSSALWQAKELGGLGCKLLPPLIEHGVHELIHVSNDEGTAFCTFEELRQRWPRIPTNYGGISHPNVGVRGPGVAQQAAVNRGPRSPMGPIGGYSVAAQYVAMVRELKRDGVKPVAMVHAVPHCAPSTVSSTCTTTMTTTTTTTMQAATAVPLHA